MRKKYVDGQGRIHLPDNPYKSKLTALIFDPFVVKQSRAGFGGQLQDHTGNWVWDKAKIGYKAKQQSDEVFENVSNYIVQYKDDGQRMNIFKNALQSRINDAKMTTSEYNIEQLSDFFPWIMSCQLLFEPLRSYMFCLYHKINAKRANDVQSSISSQMVNHDVNRAIYQTVLQNGSLVEEAKLIYKQNDVGVIIRGFRAAIGKWEGMKQVVSSALDKISQKIKQNGGTSAMNFAKKVRQYITGNNSTSNNNDIFAEEQRQAKSQGERSAKQGVLKFFDELAEQIFKELRVYGEVVVNVNYIRHSAIRRIFDGKLLYYYIQRPTLLFGMENSFLTVYTMNQSNQINIVEPGQFTLSFLKKLVQTQIVNLGGRMFKNIKDQISMTAEEKAGFNKFSNKFLKWKSYIPAISKNALQKTNDKTLIKKVDMDQKLYEKLKNAYKSDVQDQKGPTYVYQYGANNANTNTGIWSGIDLYQQPYFQQPSSNRQSYFNPKRSRRSQDEQSDRQSNRYRSRDNVARSNRSFMSDDDGRSDYASFINQTNQNSSFAPKIQRPPDRAFKKKNTQPALMNMTLEQSQRLQQPQPQEKPNMS